MIVIYYCVEERFVPIRNKIPEKDANLLHLKHFCYRGVEATFKVEGSSH